MDDIKDQIQLETVIYKKENVPKNTQIMLFGETKSGKYTTGNILIQEALKL